MLDFESNANILHGLLDLGEHVGLLDINSGCSGYVEGLNQACALIAAGCRAVILVTADTLSRLVNPRDRSVRHLFGDGASASLIVEDQDNQSDVIVEVNNDGSGFKSIIVEDGGFRNPISESSLIEQGDSDGNWRCPANIRMDGGEVFNFAVRREPESVRSVLEFAGFNESSIDRFYFHQANKYIIKNICRRLKVEDSLAPVESMRKYGNLSSSSIPVAIIDDLGNTSGARRTNLKAVLSGFGVGLSWGSIVLDITGSTELTLERV